MIVNRQVKRGWTELRHMTWIHNIGRWAKLIRWQCSLLPSKQTINAHVVQRWRLRNPRWKRMLVTIVLWWCWWADESVIGRKLTGAGGCNRSPLTGDGAITDGELVRSENMEPMPKLCKCPWGVADCSVAPADADWKPNIFRDKLIGTAGANTGFTDTAIWQSFRSEFVCSELSAKPPCTNGALDK